MKLISCSTLAPAALSRAGGMASAAVLFGALALTGSSALAWGPGDHDGPRGGPELRAPRHGGEPPRWFDGAYGHNHQYVRPGWWVARPPLYANLILWGGVSYYFLQGVWYAPSAGGYVVVRPPYGAVVAELPPFRTVVTLGGMTYYYANGAYYRPLPGGFEVVAPPVAGDGGGSAPTAPERSFVYPRNGQNAEQQASDEYECHRWAVTQSGYDPSAAATGQGGTSTGSDTGTATQRSDYNRARGACLDGRGYTVR